MKKRVGFTQTLSDQQSSVLPHKAMRNSAQFQGVLLKRTPLSPLQRAGKLLIGTNLIALGAFFMVGIGYDFVRHDHVDPFGVMISIVFTTMGFGLGGKMSIDAIFPPKRGGRVNSLPTK